MWIDALHEAPACSRRMRPPSPTRTSGRMSPGRSTATAPSAWPRRTSRRPRAGHLDAALDPRGGRAFVSINKALVTQASSAIPVVPLYISLLYRVMKAKGSSRRVHRANPPALRRPPLPRRRAAARRSSAASASTIGKCAPTCRKPSPKLWTEVTTENLSELSDIEGYRAEFLRLFGFGLPGVDYTVESDPIQPLPSSGS